MKIHACPACGSRSIRPATVADGAYAGGGELTLSVCERCGERGQPLEFADKESYRAFVQSRRGGKAESPRPSGLATGGDRLDRWSSNDTLALMVGLSFAIVALVSLTALGLSFVARNDAWLRELGSDRQGAVFVLVVAGVLAYFFLRPDGPRLSPGRPGVRRRVLHRAWVALLITGIGALMTLGTSYSGARALLEAGGLSRLAFVTLGVGASLLLWLAFLLWGLSALRDHRALRTVPRHLRS
jgi:hypothetical protein